jgi:hypothetical protein
MATISEDNYSFLDDFGPSNNSSRTSKRRQNYAESDNDDDNASIKTEDEEKKEEEEVKLRTKDDINKDKELKGKKVIKRKKPFTEPVLCSDQGLKRIYEEFPMELNYQGRFNEAQAIKKLMKLYQEWALQLHPGLSFDDIIRKCESFGTRGVVGRQLESLRNREKQRYLVEVLGIPLSDLVQQDSSPMGKTSPEVSSPEKDKFSNRETNRRTIDDDEDDDDHKVNPMLAAWNKRNNNDDDDELPDDILASLDIPTQVVSTQNKAVSNDLDEDEMMNEYYNNMNEYEDVEEELVIMEDDYVSPTKDKENIEKLSVENSNISVSDGITTKIRQTSIGAEDDQHNDIADAELL